MEIFSYYNKNVDLYFLSKSRNHLHPNLTFREYEGALELSIFSYKLSFEKMYTKSKRLSKIPFNFMSIAMSKKFQIIYYIWIWYELDATLLI